MAADRAPQWHRHSHRKELIGLVLEFVVRARELAGVREIALIGSLCTEKRHPKDADLLVSITDDLDLSPLARHARRLQGQAQSIGHGADVFLLAETGEYLGRVCHWKDCRPGMRISCDALHCGKREYLHDDLGTVRLSPDITAAPPVRLWPEVAVSDDVPRDVAELLVRPLIAAGGADPTTLSR